MKTNIGLRSMKEARVMPQPVWKRSMSLVVLLSLFAIGMAFAPTASAQTNMSALLAKYNNYDYPPADGNIEISSLTPIAGVEGNVDAAPRDVPLTLVFVEPRLLNTINGS